jgi:D-3-phosphoglycerate dehydrogenase
MSAPDTTGPVVAYSERLGEITDIERRLERELGAQIRRVSVWSAQDVRDHAADCDAILVGAVEPMDAAALAELKRCRILVRRGAGVDNVDIAAATALGLPVAFVPDATVEEVSDHALALLLAVARRVALLDGAVRGGAWTRDATTLAQYRRGIRRLDSLTLGIIGLGRIGQALTRKSRGLFGSLVAFDPYADEAVATSLGVRLTGFEELLAEADLISLHAPSTPETHHLFDAAAFGRMKPGAGLVNTARGGLVDEVALAAAMREGRLAGAGLDVTETEPLPADSPLLAIDGVLLTAHSAQISETASDELRRRAVDAAIAGLQGRVPAALADRSVLDRADCRLTAPRPWDPASGDQTERDGQTQRGGATG